MRKVVGVVSSCLKELFRPEDSRMMRGELIVSLGVSKLTDVVKTLVWFGLAGAGVLVLSLLT